MIAITGATGQLGQYVIESLMKTVPASQIVAIVRNPAKAQALTAQGITVRQADYGDEAALTSALQGVEKLLLISSSEVGQRAPQHRNVINAAKTAGVKFIAYTSLLHADKSPLGLADEHIETEKMLADSGIVYTLLRNGWYTENYLASAPAALEHGVFIGAAGDGKIASATRADYAAAAARVISEAGHEGKVYELALSIPRASALFRKYDMDYCCGGKQTLARAAARKELDVEVIEAELAKLAEQPIEKDWRSAPLAEIIDHIIVRYHARHREQLPELILQATKVERVHADKPSVPKGLTKYLTMLHEELSSHMMKEEQILFPMIKQGMGSQAMGPISVMESEHDEAGELLEVIKHNTNNVTPPPEACTTWKAMYNGINELIDDLMDHISLENNVLFPRALAGE